MRLSPSVSPSGYKDVSAFSAAPCVRSARSVRGRRDGAAPCPVLATSLRTPGALFFFSPWNRHAQ
ncbi:hypothetical protein ACVWWQ_002674 [Rhodanobacter sp. TND4EL1]